MALLVTIIATFAAYRYAETAETRAKVYAAPNEWLESILAAQQAELSGYKILDAKAGTAQIPIDDAISIVAGENSLGSRMAGLDPPRMPEPDSAPAPRVRGNR